MAEFVAPQFQNPDILGSYIRGQMAPLQMQAAQQENQYRGLQMEQLKMVLQNQKLYQQYAQGLLNQEGAQNLGGRSGGIQNGPQDAVSHQSPGNPTQPSGSYDGSVGGFQPNTLAALAILRGDDPLKTMQGAQEYALKQRQMQAQGPMALAETVSSSPNADVIVKNNPSLQQQWIQIAPQLGLDPFKDLTPENARKAAIFGYNQLAGSAGLPPKPMPSEIQQIRGPNGQLLSRNPVTGEVKQEVPEESLHQVIGANGQPVLLPASQAAGKTPFNQSIFGAANMSDQAIQFAADTYRTTGKMPAALGRNPAMQAKILEQVAKDAQASGDSTGAIAARSAALKANGQALDQVTKLESATTSFASTLDKNLDTLMQIKDKVDSSGVPLLNKAYRAWQQGVSGDPEVAKYVTMLNAVEGEYAKINSGSLGNAPTSDAAKRDAKDVINKFMTSGQIDAVAQTMRQETQNRLSSIREQKQSLMGGLSQGAPGQTTPAAQSYKSADDVKAAFHSGKITRDQAKQILTSQFGMR